MAAGVVPVCTAIGYNCELIEHGGTGFLCTTQKEWYSCLITLIDHPEIRQNVAIKARKKIVSEFSVASQAEKLHTLFLEAIGEKPAQGLK